MSYVVDVTQSVKVTVDPTKFDEAFMQEFREGFFSFTTLEQHAEHLAQLYARGIVDDDQFIEGYGPASEMGIKFEAVGQEQNVVGLTDA